MGYAMPAAAAVARKFRLVCMMSSLDFFYIVAPAFHLRMILSENRFPLFGIMR
jgi:hypothetical protein